MSVIADIADAVAAALNAAPAGTFAQAFTAQRAYLPQFDLKDMADLHVTVVPKGADIQAAGRNVGQYDYSIDVGIQKKFSGDSEADALMTLAEQVADYFRGKRLASHSAAWARSEHSHLYAQDHMRELGQFTSVVTLTFRVLR